MLGLAGTVTTNVFSADEKIELYKQQILETEIAFAELVNEAGIRAGFLAYAHEQSVLNRNNTLIKGRQEMAAYFDNMEITDIRLQWVPDFIDVSVSGDLGYTYGQFTFSGRDSEGKELHSEGVFHTVWKRNDAGEWRFVWD